MPHLTPDEIAHYHREGYVIPQYRLPAARINALCITLDRLIAKNPGVRPEKLVSAHVERKPGQGVNRDGKNDEGVKGSRDFLALAMDPAILDLSRACWDPTSFCGARTCSANRPAMATRHLGIRTATTGRCARSPTALCGWRWNNR